MTKEKTKANMEKAIVKELRSDGEWDEAWKQQKLKKVKKNSLFGLHFDMLMSKYLESGLKILEIGCAGGKFLVYFNQKFDCEVFGVDYSPAGCKLAEKNLEFNKIKGTIICDDIFKCEKLSKESFDVVFSGGLIEHFDDTEMIVNKHLEFLKPGGKLIVELPNMLGFHGFIFRTFNKKHFYEHKMLSMKMVEECFKNLGIRIKENKYIGSICFESGGKPKFIQPFFFLVNKIFYFVAKSLNIFFESEKLSSYIVVIGEKPNNV